MNKHIKEHLQGITVDSLMQFREEAYIEMAFSQGRGVSCGLGVNATGQFVVKTRAERFVFDSPMEAIDKYTELVSS